MKSSTEAEHSAQQNVEKTAKVANWVFTAPSPAMTIGPIFCIAAVFSFLISPKPGDVIFTFLNYAICALALPAVIAAFGSYALMRALGGATYLRRTMLLALLDIIFVGLIAVVMSFVAKVFPMSSAEILVFAYSVVAWINYMVFIGTADSRPTRIAAPALLHTFAGFAGAYVIFPNAFDAKGTAVAIAILCFFLVSVITFISISNAPMKRAFGISGLEMMRQMLAHWTEGGKTGTDELENFFSSFGEKLAVHVGLVSFRKKDSKNIKLLALVPSVHPGPFGELGGSNLPEKLTAGLAQKTKHSVENTMVFHGPCTHDLNLARSSETEKLIDKLASLIESAEYSDKATKFARAESAGKNAENADSFELCAQSWGDTIMLVHTSSPEPTDDIDFATGYAIMEGARAHSKDALLVDAHNCIVRGCGAISFGTRKARAMVEVGKALSSRLSSKDAERGAIKVGYAASKKNAFHYENDGLGPYGIQAMVVEVAGQKVAYLLFDGNNMDRGLREELRKAVSALVDDSEVLTTDNHIVNATMGGYNPVGKNMAHKSIADETVAITKRAIADLEDVEVGASSGYVDDVLVFGHDNTARLTSVINSLISTMKLTSALSLAFAVSASMLALSLA